MNAIKPPDEHHEAVVCAAFAFACSAGPLGGYCLEDLVTRYVAELISCVRERYPVLETVDKIEWGGSFTGKFVFPFDADLPSEVHEVLGSAKISRPAEEKSVDAVVFGPDMTSYDVMVEAKSNRDSKYARSKVVDALKRQDKDAKVSFIVSDKVPENEPIFAPEEFQILNRKERKGKKFAKGGPLCTRIFHVTIEQIDGSNKVKLDALDGGRAETLPDRVIFIICLDEINRKYRPSK